jgi:hypothetical protein
MRSAWTALLVAGLAVAPWSQGGAQRLERSAYAAPLPRAEVNHSMASQGKKPSFVMHVAVGAGVGALIGMVGGVAFTACDSPRSLLCGQYQAIPMLMGISALTGAYAGALVYIVRRLIPDDPGPTGAPSPTR